MGIEGDKYQREHCHLKVLGHPSNVVVRALGDDEQ